MKENKSGWQFPKALEIIKCKEGSKEFMKERPARRPFGNTVLICEYPIDDTAAEEPNAKLITWRLAKRAARDFLRVSFMPSAIVSAATHGGKPPSASTVNIKSHERSYSIMFSKKRQNAAFAAIASHRSGKTSTRRKNRVLWRIC